MMRRPELTITRTPDGARRIEATAIVNETARTVVAERVQRADTFLTRLVGLLGRDRMDADEALWISPCKGIHTIGMRFPIDAVFLDRSLKVVEVRERVVPWRATRFVGSACSVLELAEGGAARAGVHVGDQLEFLAASEAVSSEATS